MFESNDTFVEEAVKANPSTKDKALKTIFLVLTIVFVFLALFLGAVIFWLLATVCLILTIVFMGTKNVEYEYDYTNGTLEIAKIIDNAKRKRVVTVESAEVRMVAAMGTNESLKYDHVNLKKFDCSSNEADLKQYVLIAHDEKKNEDFKILFSPSEKLLNAMKHYNKRDIYI